MGQISALAMHDAGPSFRCTQVSVLKPAALMLFAAGNHIPALLLPPCPLSALLRSLCTPANTRLITPLSIGPRFTPKDQEVLSSLCCLSISFSHIGLYNLLSILFFSLQANLKPWRSYVLDIVVTCCTLIKLRMLDVPVFTLKLVCFGVLFITHGFMKEHSRHVWKCA